MAKRITSSTNHGWRNFLRREILRAYETDGEHNGDFNLIRLFTEAPEMDSHFKCNTEVDGFSEECLERSSIAEALSRGEVVVHGQVVEIGLG